MSQVISKLNSFARFLAVAIPLAFGFDSQCSHLGVGELLLMALHGVESALQMPLVHVEIVALEWVRVHARVDREEVALVLRRLAELDKHLEVGRGVAADDRGVPVLALADL